MGLFVMKGQASPSQGWEARPSETLRQSRPAPVLRMRPAANLAAVATRSPSPRKAPVSERKRFTFRISVENHAALRLSAEREGTSANGLLTRALAAWLAREADPK